jgi:hypothetical protein
VDDALRDLWQAADADVPFNPNLGIYKYWRDHREELGSPVGPERSAPGGVVFQAFASGKIVKWTPGGPEIV